MKIVREDIVAYIKNHPKKRMTNRELAAAFQLPTPNMATRLKQHFDAGYLTREVTAMTASKVPIYTYAVADNVTKDMPKAERIAKRLKAKLPLENGEKTVRAPLENDEMASLVKRLAEGLASQISAQVMVELHAQLQHDLRSIIPAKVPMPDLPALPGIIHQPEPEATVKDRKTKVLVIGLLPTQAGMIATEFGEVFTLNFWKNESYATLRQHAAKAHEVLAMSGFVSHSDIEVVESVRKCKPVLIHGGMTALRTALTTLYVEQGE